jgi:hypothetical protein
MTTRQKTNVRYAEPKEIMKDTFEIAAYEIVVPKC